MWRSLEAYVKEPPFVAWVCTGEHSALFAQVAESFIREHCVFPEISPEALETAHTILVCYYSVREHAADSADQFDCAHAVDFVRGFHLGMPFDYDIEDYRILTAFAIAEAWQTLERLLYHGESPEDVDHIQSVTQARGILSEAGELLSRKQEALSRERARESQEREKAAQEGQGLLSTVLLMQQPDYELGKKRRKDVRRFAKSSARQKKAYVRDRDNILIEHFEELEKKYKGDLSVYKASILIHRKWDQDLRWHRPSAATIYKVIREYQAEKGNPKRR
jgi:hypothetical protein